MTGTSDSALVVGWLGLGIMGEAMCTRLVKAGTKVVVWNRTQAKVREGSGLRAVVASATERRRARAGAEPPS
jgi:3-hydroxyisobutyrate dehydrogenase-like beta-hydroxyacid dehydrogenase